LWRAGLTLPRPQYEPVLDEGEEHYDALGSLHPESVFDGAPDDHFLRYPHYDMHRFVQGVAADVLLTRDAKAVGAPGLGFIDQFNVGGGVHIPGDLLANDLEPAGDDAFAIPDPAVRRVPGLAVPFCHYGYTAFGHFVLDGLLQVHLWEKELRAGEAQLVHWPLYSDWMDRALAPFALPAAARRELDMPVALFQRAALSSALGAHGVYFPGAYSRRFFAWLAARLEAAPSGPARRLYVRRMATSLRPVRNSAELEALVVSHGFEVLDPAEHDLAEQARAFASAEAVLSAWGSTLTLAPLMRGRRLVVELLPDTVTDNWFHRQAIVHGLEYLPLLHAAEPDGAFTADLELLDRTLRSIL
jgi:hypothetical protein